MITDERLKELIQITEDYKFEICCGERVESEIGGALRELITAREAREAMRGVEVQGKWKKTVSFLKAVDKWDDVRNE